MKFIFDDHFKELKKLSRLSRLILLSFTLTFLTVLLGSTFALYQNWNIGLELTKSDLLKNAELGSYLIERNVINILKTLDTTKEKLESSIQTKTFNPQTVAGVLSQSLHDVNNYSSSDFLGLQLVIDKTGALIARSDGKSTENINYIDRYYFFNLKNNKNLNRTIGPLLISRTTNEWVFHVAVPIHDTKGDFFGVLAQQVIETEIINELKKYADIKSFDLMINQFDGIDASFIYPLPDTPNSPSIEELSRLGHMINQLHAKSGFELFQSIETNNQQIMIGFSHSPIFNMLTFVSVPLERLVERFLLKNAYLFTYIVLGFLFVSTLFYYLFCISVDLAASNNKSLTDTLTGLSNRRALDERIHPFLRDSMRTREPISVLFADIDLFRNFNELYGHEFGDVVLHEVAMALASCCKRPMDFVCRWGGEEFVAILPNTNGVAAAQVSQAMLESVRSLSPIFNSKPTRSITISVGYVTCVMNSKNMGIDLIDLADHAMQEAKNRGRNQAFQHPSDAALNES